ncbi:NEDD8 ultimate buster 1-like, partial [Perognathus longimembris pacificus]|uniref:NEDD8 ultimate buster 1-like n=1 Tax=Perognathus longimembris pacificus TaxID=214514 RepID=UPI002019A285
AFLCVPCGAVAGASSGDLAGQKEGTRAVCSQLGHLEARAAPWQGRGGLCPSSILGVTSGRQRPRVRGTPRGRPLTGWGGCPPKELAQIRKEEKEKKRRRLESIDSLRRMGYSAPAAKRALHHAGGNLDEALKFLLSNPHLWWLHGSDPDAGSLQGSPAQESVDQLVYMGFDAAVAEAALRVFGGNVQLAAQTLAHHGGALPPDLQLSEDDSSSTPSTSPSDSAGTSSASTDEDMELEAVNEILEDIPEHEEDYLDSTLEDEEIIIAEYLSYVENIKSAPKET